MRRNDSVEFIFPDKTHYILWQEHINRYIFALRFVSSKIVFDLACGTGYGTKLLSETSDFVIGADISREALAYAKRHYGRVHNTEFILSDAHNLPFRDEVFDSVVSFETIEHLVHYEKFIHEIHRVMSAGGQFILSTPNRERSARNPFHVKEFNVEELSQSLGNFSKGFQLYGQCYDRINDWILQILSNLLSAVGLMNSFKRHQGIAEKIYKPPVAGGKNDRKSSLISSILSTIIDPTYRVRKFRKFYSIYAPKFLIAVATK